MWAYARGAFDDKRHESIFKTAKCRDHATITVEYDFKH